MIRRALGGATLFLLAACSHSERAAFVTKTVPTITTTSTSTTVAPTTTISPDPVVALAATIVASEQAIRDPATPDVVTAARSGQAAYRTLVDHADWLDAVLAGAPEPLRPVIRANVDAGTKLSQLGRPSKAAPPAGWHILTPAPQDELLGYYKAAEAEFGVPWQYLAAVHLVETRMGRIRGSSSAGALGPMQFLPTTWAAYGDGDIHSNKDSIRAAARYLKRNGAPGDMRNALWNYNHSFLYVDAVTIYAQQMQANERAYVGYYHWQVYYRTINGDVLLPEGWSS